MKYFLDAIKRFDDLKGTATRKEYWSFVGINVLIFLVVQILGVNLGFNISGYLYIIITVIPFTSISVRRLRDVGKKPVIFAVALLFPIGTLYVLYYLLKKGANK